MATRRPIVRISGRFKELPAGDLLPSESGASQLHIGETAPVDPVATPFWWNEAAGAFLVHIGAGIWIEPGVNSIPYIGDTAPDPDLRAHWITLSGEYFVWDGTAWFQVIGGTGNTDTVAEGTTNLYHTAARVLGTVLAGLSTATNAAITAADTVLVALGKLQRQITDHFGSGGATHAAATTGANGFMSADDKSKLDGIAASATAVSVADIRAQVEAALVAGTNLTITPAGAGAARTLTLAASGGGGGSVAKKPYLWA